ncbi:MAG TPA: hypothetical protein DD435_15395 [Cyanobacteria bacterium UBA8530]|nr:hypothetical protein [Cyanobacteria bacterium UBA8530]
MRICLLSPESCRGGAGGIATYTDNLARALVEGDENNEVTVVLPGKGGRYRQKGISYREIPLPPRLHIPMGNRYFGNTLAAIPFILACRREVNELIDAGLDVVESPEWMAGGLLLALEGRVPVITRLHTHLRLVRRLNGLPIDLDARFFSFLERSLILHSSLVLSNSSALAWECARDLDLPHGIIEVLPLGIDTKVFFPREAQPKKPVILYLGRLERRKGVDVLAEAFALIAEQFPSSTLVLAGTSTQTATGQRDFKEELLETHAELVRKGRMVFLGGVPYGDIPELCAGCDILAAPSPFEAFGMVYLEAMASGKPVVGCNSGGAPEVVVPGKTGILVKPREPGEMAEALAFLLSNDRLRAEMGRQAREHVLQHFESGRIAQRTLAFYLRARENWRLRKREAYVEAA